MNIGFRQTPLELDDYLAILRRRKLQLLVPFVLVFMISLGLAYGLPSVYKSEATILIERQEIPAELVQTTVTGYVQERIQSIKQRIVTSNNLWDIAENLDLYSEERKPENRFEIVKKMREGIEVAMVDVKAVDPGDGRQKIATVAFTVSFEANTPEVAQKVTHELATRYLEENQRERLRQSKEVSNFLAGEAEKLSNEMATFESQLAAFKQENLTELPELSNVNLKLFEQADEQLERTEDKIRSLELQEIALQEQLRVVDPYAPVYAGNVRVAAPEDRLASLQADYLSKSSVYSYDHPDLVNMRREIEVLQKEVGATSGNDQLVQQLEILRARLGEAKQRYSQEHPDVKRLQSSITNLERELRSKASEKILSQSRPPDNPQYVGLQSQLDAVKANLVAERERRNELEKKLEEYEARLFQTPIVERDYLMLTRGYDNALKKYREIKDKQLKAELAQQLETEQKAERFTLVQPATFPDQPERPNRLGIALLGFVLSFGSGIGSASISEYRDRSVRGFRGVSSIMQAPPLTGIPYIKTKTVDKSTNKQKRKVAAVFAASIIMTSVIILTVSHYYWKPIDQMWLEINQQLDQLSLLKPFLNKLSASS